MAAAVASLAGCSSDGPQQIASTTPSVPTAEIPYNLVPLTLENVHGYKSARDRVGGAVARHRVRPPDQVVAVGDYLRVVVFESRPDGLFATPAAGGSRFEPLVVDSRGMITLPYANNVKVSGYTLPAVERLLVERLSEKASQPAVSVSLVTARDRYVTVSGDVKLPGRIPLTPEVVTVHDAALKGGAPTERAIHVDVTVRRGGRVILETPLSRLIGGSDIPVHPNDDIVVTANRKAVTVLGAIAVSKAGRYDLERLDMSLMDVLGNVGGLNDDRSNATGVFIFRLWAERDPYDPKAPPHPTIYQLDMSRTDSLFIAQIFTVRPRDVIFVTNAPLAEWSKVISLFVRTASIASIGVTLSK